MKALILNSGLGSRLGNIVYDSHKCLLKINNLDTILYRQLHILLNNRIDSIVMTTGYNADKIMNYCSLNFSSIKINFVYNELFDKTNYIYSIYKAKDFLYNDDILLLHGDLVFDESIIKDFIDEQKSVMAVSSMVEIPKKDFKALINNGKIDKIGIEFFNNVLAAQPLYKINKNDFNIWLNKIVDYCENGNTNCYAENAFNEVSNKCLIYPYDVKDRLCFEIDNLEDLNKIKEKLKWIK